MPRHVSETPHSAVPHHSGIHGFEALVPWSKHGGINASIDPNPSHGLMAVAEHMVESANNTILSTIRALHGSKGQLFYPLVDFAKEIMGMGPRSSERIVEIYRRKDTASPVGHEFLIVAITTDDNVIFYLRLDRRPSNENHWPAIFMLSSKVHASDSVSRPLGHDRYVLTSSTRYRLCSRVILKL